MKILTTKSNLMLSAFAFLAISLSSCKKDEAVSITEDDAADIISSTMARPVGGSADDASELSRFARVNIFIPGPGRKWLECGQTKDTTFQRTITSGLFTATHTHSITATLNCENQKPSSLVWTGNITGTFDGPKMSGNSTGVRNWTLTGFGPDQSLPLVLNGTVSRNGVRTSKIRNQYTFETNVNHTYTNVTIDKATDKITGGTGTVSAVIKVSNGNTRTYEGTIVFNGDDTATLTINGRVFTIQLN
ncbi:MAG: hypothetical protein FGM46_04770 [Ferruginibacter sp.]|nr:hypothetical protein [Ferruginibacter sp.]